MLSQLRNIFPEPGTSVAFPTIRILSDCDSSEIVSGHSFRY